jgi:5,10-methylene-tetrahydrofolate dehydrogenase/methenyl tetrahydrofolate cyclohydrolase
LIDSDPNVHGILVQLPLPAHINETTVLHRILQQKDVDGLHPLNVAQLANTKTHAPGRSAWSFDAIDFHVSCTPQVSSAIMKSLVNLMTSLDVVNLDRVALSCWIVQVLKSMERKQSS